MRNQLSGAVAVLDKAVDLLECLADGAPRTVAELCAETGVSKAAAYRILDTLERRGFVVTYERVRRYTIGPSLLLYAEAARHSDRLLAASRPVMNDLRRFSGETINLGIHSRGQVLYLEIMESERGLRATGKVGSLDALHSTALGKAMLSRLPKPEVDRAVGRAVLTPRTQHTVTDRNVLRRSLLKVRADGFAIDDQENEIGMRCVAAPILDSEGLPLGAISISGPSSRMTPATVASLVTRLKESCAVIAQRLTTGVDRHPKAGRSLARAASVPGTESEAT